MISEFTYCTVECASVLESKNVISSSLTRLLKTLLMRNEGIVGFEMCGHIKVDCSIETLHLK